MRMSLSKVEKWLLFLNVYQALLYELLWFIHWGTTTTEQFRHLSKKSKKTLNKNVCSITQCKYNIHEKRRRNSVKKVITVGSVKIKTK